MEYSRQILTIVNHGLGEKIAALTRTAGARGGTILIGQGSVSSFFFRMLALSDVEKDILITLVSDDQLAAVYAAIRDAPVYTRKKSGISFVIKTGGTAMGNQGDHELITIIVNRGYAEDVMEAARKAGARGGTIVHARGTGKPDDEKFFGITIVPEKEQILILAERAGAEAIKNAIRNLRCLTEPGIGIMYTTPVEQFTVLGTPEAQ